MLSGQTQPAALVPGFMLVQGNRLEDLRDLAVQWLVRQPLAPLENEVVLVQSNGIAQWLKLALAADPAATGGGCGIAAALDVMLPARLQWQVYRAVLGDLPEQSPFDKAPLAWRLMRLLPALLTQQVFAPLQRYLSDDGDQRKRYQLAHRLADLFDQYQVYRADWLADWAEDRDQLRLPDGSIGTLEAEQCWQPALWRAILTDVPAAERDSSRASVHRRFLAASASWSGEQRPARMPRRVVVFGISSLPQQMLEVLAALARCTQVLLCVHNPCRHYWGDIVEGRELFRSRAYRRQDANRFAGMTDEAIHLDAHPLLAAWGKQGRDYMRLLDEHDDRKSYEPLFAAENLAVDLFVDPAAESLLGQLQGDILNLCSLADRKQQVANLPESDSSVVFHVAHSPQREVEILHDRLLDAFHRDPSLQPRDIMVMVPDINTYAPHIRAVFGQVERSDPRWIPFTIADQAKRQQQPLLLALEGLLRSDISRFAVSDVLDWLEVPALRARFGISEASLPLLQRWMHGAQIRWGLHAAQRASLGLPTGIEQNSWQAGLRRMLLGYAVGAGETWAGIEPYDEIGGLDAALAGALADLLVLLEQCWGYAQQTVPPAQWGERLQQLLASAFLPQSDEDRQLLDQLAQQLDDWVALCADAGFTEALPLAVVREHWLDSVEQPQLGQRFLAGAVNFATLMPMRAIPFRRICLLGMNDGDFPRRQPAADFDLMAKAGHYRPGDRSRRDDDRYLFLEALLSAREQLYISWVGRSIRDNSERPPSVLVAQLRDHLAAGWSPRAVVQHPLQPFSPRYFPLEQHPQFFTYASEWRAVHDEVAIHHPVAITPVDAPLPVWRAQAPLNLRLLADFLRYPVEHFFRQRLQVVLREENATAEDCEPFAVDALQRWQWQDQLLHAAAACLHDDHHADDSQLNAVLQQQVDALVRSGALPLPPFDALNRDALLEPLPAQLQRYRDYLQQYPLVQDPQSKAAAEIQFECGAQGADGALQLHDWLPPLRTASASAQADEPRVLLQLVSGRLHAGQSLKWYQLVRYWPQHLAAQLAGVPTQTVLVSQSGDVVLPSVARDVAAAQLDDLLHWYAEGMCQPLPAACKTAFAWLQAEADRQDDSAADVYEGGFARRGECEDSALLLRCWPDFAAMRQHPLFEACNRALYLPLLQCLASGDALVVDECVANQQGDSVETEA